ncbi:MAG: hypothetical protein COS68_05080, partial [Elusimicrobia bacterium CG06_land_8_20_14_3_00_38_11]
MRKIITGIYPVFYRVPIKKSIKNNVTLNSFQGLKRCRNKFGMTLCVILHFTFYIFNCLFAVPHINGKNPGPKEYVHKIPDIRTLKAAGLSQQAIARTVGTTGTRQIAVILVNFSDAGTNTSGYPTMSRTDITGFNTTFDYLKNF